MAAFVKGCKMPAPSRWPVSLHVNLMGRRLTTLNTTCLSLKGYEPANARSMCTYIQTDVAIRITYEPDPLVGEPDTAPQTIPVTTVLDL